MSTTDLEAALELVRTTSERLRESDEARIQLRNKLEGVLKLAQAGQQYIRALEASLPAEELLPHKQAYERAVLASLSKWQPDLTKSSG